MEFSRTVFCLLNVLILYAECDLSGFKELVFGKRLTGALIEAIYKVSFLDCVEDCIGRRRCVSVNYERRNLLCELNYHLIRSTSYASDDTMQTFDDEKTFVFTDMKSWDKGIAGSCSEKPCRENEKCVPKSFTEYECKISDCSPLPDVDDAIEVMNTSSLVKIGVGARRFFACEQGFLPRDVVGMAICMSDGTWQGPNIECTGPFHTCYEILNKDSTLKSGVYTIHVDNRPTDVSCDMETDGGGWTVIQRRQNGNTDFYRSWYEYKTGFGNASDEYWIGNDVLHVMTRRQVILRVDLEQFDGTKGYGTYSTFKVDNESKNYKLHLDGFEGNIKNCLKHINRNDFSTKDRDNDRWIVRSCAVWHQGGWWYNKCSTANFNGQYYTYAKTCHDCIFCWQWTNYSFKALNYTKMMIR